MTIPRLCDSTNIDETHIAYSGAARIDAMITNLMIKRPLDTNQVYWRVLCRTVGSGLSLIEKVVEKSSYPHKTVDSRNAK